MHDIMQTETLEIILSRCSCEYIRKLAALLSREMYLTAVEGVMIKVTLVILMWDWSSWILIWSDEENYGKHLISKDKTDWEWWLFQSLLSCCVSDEGVLHA